MIDERSAVVVEHGLLVVLPVLPTVQLAAVSAVIVVVVRSPWSAAAFVLVINRDRDADLGAADDR